MGGVGAELERGRPARKLPRDLSAFMVPCPGVVAWRRRTSQCDMYVVERNPQPWGWARWTDETQGYDLGCQA